MANLQDIQKLRINKTPQTYYATSQRFSQPSTPDIYNINLDKMMAANNDQLQNRSMYPIKFYETYSKYVGSKEMLPNNNDKKVHKRGQSNGVPYSDRRESDLISSGLSMYRFAHLDTTCPCVRPRNHRFRSRPEGKNQAKSPILN